MSASLKIILHSKTHGDGTRAVMLQCILSSPSGNVWKRRSLCRVKPAQFDKASGRIIKHPNALVLNALIAEQYNRAEKRLLMAQMNGLPVDPAAVVGGAEAQVDKSGLLLAHGRAYVARCSQKGQYHTAEKYEGHLNRLAEYLGKDKAGEQRDIPMDQVSEDWLVGWANWLKSHGTKSANTLHRRMAFITTLFIDARKRGLTKADPMAFLEFKEQPVRKPKLSVEQLAQLEGLTLTGKADDARNTFLLQFFAYGTRISDALTWKKADIHKEGAVWYLKYTSMKTGDLIDVRLNGKAKELVSRYLEQVPGPFLLPWLAKFVARPDLSDGQNKERLIDQIEAKTTTINTLLKTIAKDAELGVHLTTHIARHTFASLADSKVTDKRKISAALGHSKFATTEVYLAQLRQSDVNDAMDEIWK